MLKRPRRWLRPLAPLGLGAFVLAPLTVTLTAPAEAPVPAPRAHAAPSAHAALEAVADLAVPVRQAAYDARDEAARAGRRIGEGEASYYGNELRGRRTANGERFDPEDLTAAHRTLPFGTRVRVTNLRTERSVIVRINDRGPFTRRRIIDVSRAAAAEIGMVRAGHARVLLEHVDTEDLPALEPLSRDAEPAPEPVPEAEPAPEPRRERRTPRRRRGGW